MVCHCCGDIYSIVKLVKTAMMLQTNFNLNDDAHNGVCCGLARINVTSASDIYYTKAHLSMNLKLAKSRNLRRHQGHRQQVPHGEKKKYRLLSRTVVNQQIHYVKCGEVSTICLPSSNLPKHVCLCWLHDRKHAVVAIFTVCFTVSFNSVQ